MINSDDYSLIDFIEYADDNLFAKANLFYEYAEDYIDKKYFTFFRPMLTSCSPRVKIFDRYSGKPKDMIMMASNNYLNLSTHPDVIRAGKEALEKYGSGLCGSPILCGYSEIHRQLEEKLARFKSCEDCMIFPAGFSTNLGILTSLLRKNDVVITDRLDHASIMDGAIFSGAQFRNFSHNDTAKLERILRQYEKKEKTGKLIVVEGVYSMDGDIARLPAIKELASRYNARLMVDEAHATGVIGKTGKGSLEHHGLEGRIDIVMGTFSKALAGMGGFVCSGRKVINYIRFYARSYFFSASLSPVVAACVSKALDVIQAEPDRRERLFENIRYMVENLTKLGFNAGQTQSAIIPVFIGDDLVLRKMSRDIHKKGIFLNSIFFPAVPRDSSRIRLSLMADHSREDLDQTLNVLEKTARKYGVI
ncbi:MAG: aminotransferase class I/II-fold pyridoxal phosphate-dependent enzyme [Spirochaetales bacterium]|nr:aminotransferase class I/II-fold pyridoxal phosphate-dependent enzyme [Spirochaetales bacterium]